MFGERVVGLEPPKNLTYDGLPDVGDHNQVLEERQDEIENPGGKPVRTSGTGRGIADLLPYVS